MLEILTKEGHNIEEVVAFATDEARAKNGDKLCAELRANGYENSCRFVKIVDKVTDDKIWDLFEAVYNEIHPGDTIFFDVTHGFRSFPITVLAVLYYSRVLDSIKIGGIYYGNFEAHEEIGEDMYAPLDELTDLLAFLDWTYGIDTFLKTGSPRAIEPLVSTSESRREAATAEKSEESGSVLEALKGFTRSLETCKSISFQKHARNLKNAVRSSDLAGLPYRKPLEKLLDLVEKKMEPFTGDPIMDPYYAVQWCIDHGLTQQAYTMLIEHVVTVLCLLTGENVSSTSKRLSVQRYLSEDELVRKLKELAEIRPRKRDAIMDLVEFFGRHSEIVESISNLKTGRNSLNHAEYTSKQPSSEEFHKEITEIFKTLEPFFRYAKANLFRSNTTHAKKER